MTGYLSPQRIEAEAPDQPSEVENRVRRRLSGRVLGFRVVFQDDGVVLRGASRTYYAKQLAQHAVMDATDRPIVANLIEVG
jgi:hypothetical protein